MTEDQKLFFCVLEVFAGWGITTLMFAIFIRDLRDRVEDLEEAAK